MTVSKRDRERMDFLAKASAELEAETGPPSPETRRWMIRWSNERRAKRGIPPLEEVEEDEHPPSSSSTGRPESAGCSEAVQRLTDRWREATTA